MCFRRVLSLSCWQNVNCRNAPTNAHFTEKFLVHSRSRALQASESKTCWLCVTMWSSMSWCKLVLLVSLSNMRHRHELTFVFFNNQRFHFQEYLVGSHWLLVLSALTTIQHSSIDHRLLVRPFLVDPFQKFPPNVPRTKISSPVILSDCRPFTQLSVMEGVRSFEGENQLATDLQSLDPPQLKWSCKMDNFTPVSS